MRKKSFGLYKLRNIRKGKNEKESKGKNKIIV